MSDEYPITEFHLRNLTDAWPKLRANQERVFQLLDDSYNQKLSVAETVRRLDCLELELLQEATK